MQTGGEKPVHATLFTQHRVEPVFELLCLFRELWIVDQVLRLAGVLMQVIELVRVPQAVVGDVLEASDARRDSEDPGLTRRFREQ